MLDQLESEMGNEGYTNGVFYALFTSKLNKSSGINMRRDSIQLDLGFRESMPVRVDSRSKITPFVFLLNFLSLIFGVKLLSHVCVFSFGIPLRTARLQQRSID